ncbi:MAG: TetR/AcrR family transcriptional regulator [Thermanaerothrix sp.]|nr:TetR/AcrR family transcriptional regulator [Thermanaerothrix sp.]
MVSDARDSILDSARRIFALRGYEGASVDAIVRSANVSKGAFYWHFQGKFDLFQRVMEDEVVRIVSYLGEGVSDGEELLSVSIRKGEGFLRMLWEQRESLSLWFELRLLAHREVEGMRDLAGTLKNRMLHEMRSVLGEIGKVPDGLEEVLCVFFDGIMFNLMVWLDVDQAAALWRRGCEVILGGAAR